MVYIVAGDKWKESQMRGLCFEKGYKMLKVDEFKFISDEFK